MSDMSIVIRQEKETDYPAVYNVPDHVFMGLELVEGAFSGVKGIVRYAREFHEI